MADEITPRLRISYGVEQEVQRVRHSVDELPWFREQGYRVTLPNGVAEGSTSEEIVCAIKDEYSATDYAQCASTTMKEWPTVSIGFKDIQKEPSFHLEDEYSVVLTKYGVGGSYNPALNQVIVKVSPRSKGGTAGIIAHEIVHMTIQYLIDEYQVRHWRKERLVDLLMERYFPGLKEMQNIKEDISVVDQAFENLFPDIRAIAQSIGENV